MRIGSIFETITGATPPTSNIELYGVDYPFYKPADLDNGFYTDSAKDMVSKKGYETGRIVFEGSILVTCIGATIGKTGYVRKTGICNQQINVIQPTEKINSEYVYFYICSGYEQSQIKLNASATTLPILNKSNFDKLLLALPPFNEQHKITVQIKQALRLIDEIQNTKNEISSVISVLKSKILDLAIRGKLVPQNQDDEPASVLLERIKSEKEELIKQGKIKRDKKESVIFKGDDNSYYDIEFPSNWTLTSLMDISLSISDGSHNPPPKKESGVPLLSAANIFDNRINYDSATRWMTEEEWEQENKRTNLECGDVLITIVGTIGRTAIISNEMHFALQRSVAVIKPCLINSKYLMYSLQSPMIKEWLNQNAKGNAQVGIYLKDLASLTLFLPPLEEQKRIVDAIATAFEQLDNILNSI